MNALGYIRRSKKSDKKVVSLDTQREHITEYCRKRGLAVPEFITHDGISGGNRKRFEVIEQRRAALDAKHIVIYSQDRFARDSAGLLNYLGQLTKVGVTVHSATTGPIDFKSATGKLMTAVMADFDEFFKNLVSEKTSDALAYKREHGLRYTNHPPLGWKYVGGKIVADAEEQRALAIIAECRRAGMGRFRALKELRSKGYSGRGSLATIQKVLDGPLS